MCEPVSMSILAVGSIGLGVASTINQVNAQKEETEANNQAADYNASVNEKNAKILEENALLAENRAQEIERRGTADESAMRRDYRNLRGAQRASYAGAGVVVDTGSAGTVSTQTKFAEDIDAMTMRSNTAKEAYAARMQAKAETDASRDEQSRAFFTRRAKRDPNGRTLGTLLSGGSSALSGMYSFGSSYGKMK